MKTALLILTLLFAFISPSFLVAQEINPKVIEMVLVKGGTFKMGNKEGGRYEKPVHEVTLKDYYIGKYEITQAQYKEVIGKGIFDFPGADHPADRIEWFTAITFCNKLSEKEGLQPVYTIDTSLAAEEGSYDNIGWIVSWNPEASGYRLPTEAEWEYAARGGDQSKGFMYSGSNDLNEVAWYDANSEKKTTEVGKKAPNELGIYDMSGNAWEWCYDLYGEKYYRESPAQSPLGPEEGDHRILRGGSATYSEEYATVTIRNHEYPSGMRRHGVGLRVVRNK